MMSDDWVITPPFTPQTSTSENGVEGDDLDPGNGVSFTDDWDSRMFHCMGESHNSNITFHDDSYLKKNDLNIFDDDVNQSVVFVEDFGSINLFKTKFDKGAALLKDINALFRMAKFSYIQLDLSAKANVNSLVVNLTIKRPNNILKQREEIVNFLIYLRNFIQRVRCSTKYDWMTEVLLDRLYEELTKLRVLCGSVNDLPDYIVNYSVCTAGYRNTQPSYHLFHCQFDIKWLHLTILYQLILLKQKCGTKKCAEELETSLNFCEFESYLEHLMSDLIIIALKRYQQIELDDLIVKSLFTCTCTREMWKLLQLSICRLHKHGLIPSFWSMVNRICNKLVVNREIRNDSTNCVILKIPETLVASCPPIFIVWFLKHLIKLWSSGEKLEIESNHLLLETAIKMFMNTEPSESRLRIFLHFTETILNFDWDMRTEPLVLLWEYFNKKLNSLFYIPGSAISELAVVSKSASGLLTQLNSKLKQSVPDNNMDSFHLFLRLLGRSLKKWNDNPRYWSQLKGRIYSKFSAAKLSSLNEIGVYHFISLFLTLALTADLQEVSKNLQNFLNLLVAEKLDEARLKLIWKAHFTLILLFAENNQDISSTLNPILDMVELTVKQPNCLNLMRVFSEGFQDLIDSTNNLELGQYMFIGNWIPSYLQQCGESDCSRFLETLSLLICKMNSLLSAQLLVGQNNQLILLYNALWEHLIPYLKKRMCSVSTCISCRVPDVVASLTTLSFKSCFPHSTRNQAEDLLTFFICHDSIDARTLCRYLGQVSLCEPLLCLNNLNVTLIKGWLRCLIILSSDVESEENLSTITKFVVSLPEMQKLFSETQITLNPHSNCFETFLENLQLKYSSLLDIHSKSKFSNQVWSYFANVERWLSQVVKVPKSVTLAMNIYHNVGQMFFRIPELLYTRSRPNSLLQSFLDLLLLPMQIRNPQFKLNSHLSEAIKDTFYLFVCGLFKLDPENDPYIYRSIKELLTIYVPRLVTPKGAIVNHGNVQFSLLKCFESSDRFEFISKSIFEILCGAFIKKRSKTPHQFTFHTLIFFNNLIRSFKNDNAVVKCFIRNVLEKVCDVLMFCEDISPCKKEARDIVQFTLDLHFLRSESDMGNDLMEVFNKLCQEHLAFASRTLFDLLEEIITVAPDLIARFLPQFVDKIKEVERKRGVGYDRSLRKGLERIEELLRNIRNNQGTSQLY